MWLDQSATACLIPLACWILLSGIDDLFVCVAFLLHRRRMTAWPTKAEIAASPKRRIAVLVPLWREQDVIGRMLEHNISVIGYDNYDIFTGVYANDPQTRRAAQAVADRHPHVHVCVCPRPGPTSKADCLNSIYQAIEQWEQTRSIRFHIVVTHDAEDLIHPESLAAIDCLTQRFDMVQVPVLPLPSPWWELTHGLYCDEFAEYQTKDIPVRQALGGFVPSNGVGAGFTRDVLERIAEQRNGLVFEPECLTEDYENGWAVHALGRPQVFIPLTRRNGAFAATREYFPRTFRTAVRQRARWVTGIALQGWQRHGWPLLSRQCYWLFRDRKGLVGNLLAPAANLLFLYGGWGWLASRYSGTDWGLYRALPGWASGLCAVTFALSLLQVGARTACCARIYGVGFALACPVRSLAGNWLNCAATVQALWGFAAARARRRKLAWGKTEHHYPEGAALRAHKPLLGEILIRMRAVNAAELGCALSSPSRRLRIGEHLLQSGAITERCLYEALSAQTGIPLKEPARAGRAATRLLPPAVAKRWKLMPVRIQAGSIEIGVTDVPDAAAKDEIRRFSSLEIRWCLLTPADMERLRDAATRR